MIISFSQSGCCRQFSRDCRGALLIEFALIVPAFILFVVGIIEIAMLLFTNVLVEGSLREASRFGITGQVMGTAEREETIEQIVSQGTGGLVNPEDLSVNTYVFQTFTTVGTPEPWVDNNDNGTIEDDEFDDTNSNGVWDGKPGAGGSGDIVLYQVDYNHSFITGLMKKFGDASGKLTMTANIAVRNEPF